MNKTQLEKVKEFKLNFLYDEAYISSSNRKRKKLVLDENKIDLEAFKQLSEYTKNITYFVNNGYNLYLHSQICGNGKTSWAIRFVQEYFETIWLSTDLKCRALFVHVPTFLQKLKENINEKSEYVKHIRQYIENCDLVIFDDIATKSITQWESDILLSIIDNRINDSKSNIYTSNLSDEELHQVLGDRLFSRIVNGSLNVMLRGGDKRGLF